MKEQSLKELANKTTDPKLKEAIEKKAKQLQGNNPVKK
jgi:hypothetical protein